MTRYTDGTTSERIGIISSYASQTSCCRPRNPDLPLPSVGPSRHPLQWTRHFPNTPKHPIPFAPPRPCVIALIFGWTHLTPRWKDARPRRRHERRGARLCRRPAAALSDDVAGCGWCCAHTPAPRDKDKFAIGSGCGALEATPASLRPLPAQHEHQQLSLPATLNAPRFPQGFLRRARGCPVGGRTASRAPAHRGGEVDLHVG